MYLADAIQEGGHHLSYQQMKDFLGSLPGVVIVHRLECNPDCPLSPGGSADGFVTAPRPPGSMLEAMVYLTSRMVPAAMERAWTPRW